MNKQIHISLGCSDRAALAKNMIADYCEANGVSYSDAIINMINNSSGKEAVSKKDTAEEIFFEFDREIKLFNKKAKAIFSKAKNLIGEARII